MSHIDHVTREYLAEQLAALGGTTMPASNVVVDDTGLTHIIHTDAQDALADLDAAISGGGGASFPTVVAVHADYTASNNDLAIVDGTTASPPTSAFSETPDAIDSLVIESGGSAGIDATMSGQPLEISYPDVHTIAMSFFGVAAPATEMSIVQSAGGGFGVSGVAFDQALGAGTAVSVSVEATLDAHANTPFDATVASVADGSGPQNGVLASLAWNAVGFSDEVRTLNAVDTGFLNIVCDPFSLIVVAAVTPGAVAPTNEQGFYTDGLWSWVQQLQVAIPVDSDGNLGYLTVWTTIKPDDGQAGVGTSIQISGVDSSAVIVAAVLAPEVVASVTVTLPLAATSNVVTVYDRFPTGLLSIVPDGTDTLATDVGINDVNDGAWRLYSDQVSAWYIELLTML